MLSGRFVPLILALAERDPSVDERGDRRRAIGGSG
jgi:hypothetical protein